MPIESLEVRALRALAAHIGARVTSTTGGVHAATSYHFQDGTQGDGLAIDLAETSGPSSLTPGLKRIAEQVAALIGPQCKELIYAAGPNLKNGRPAWYGPSTLWAHRNHIHVAVGRGFRWTAPVTEVRPMYDPPLVLAPVVASLPAPGGGAWVLTQEGAIYAFGAPDYDAPNRHPEYWALGQKAARLEPFNGGYTVVDTAGQRYNYPAS